MEVFIGLIFIIGMVALFFAFSSNKTNDLGITMDEAAQINRAANLAVIEPQVALQLAQRLNGNARQLGLFQMPAALFKKGDQQRALQVLGELDDTYRPMALNRLLDTLLGKNDDEAALALLKNLGEPLPSVPLLRIALLHASGEQEQARELLVTFGIAQENQLGERLSSSETLRLASLQRRFDLRDEAVASLIRAWNLLVQQPSPFGDSVDMEAVLRGHIELGMASHLDELIQPLSGENKTVGVTLLMEIGAFDRALAMLENTDDPQTEISYPRLLDLALHAQQPEFARQLVERAPDLDACDMLLTLLRWHAERAETAIAEATLLACANSTGARIWCLISLWGSYLDSQPQWCESLLRQAMQELDGMRDDEQWPWMRLLVLETQLQLQSNLPDLSRDSWMIRTSLEEIATLTAQLEPGERLMKSGVQVNLMYNLGQRQEATALLDQTLQRFEDEPALEAEDKPRYLAHLALSYLHIEQPHTATRLRDRAAQMSGYVGHLSQALLASHIRHERFDEAIGELGTNTLFIDENPLQQLHQALETLGQRDPEQASVLRRKLIDRVGGDQAWGQPSAA
ncbi:hypothetical protein [Pseudomonas purpurea]|uniref:hypothetical protein n=1 Tax=Pseudomonas purpurea TaxID=3136737 RepID=UPI003263387D